MLNEEDEGWGDLFYSIEKWNPKLRWEAYPSVNSAGGILCVWNEIL